MSEGEFFELCQNDMKIIHSNIEKPQRFNQFRNVLSQIIAVSSINLMLLDLGMVLALPTIIIPELLNSKTSLSFSEEQASWFGSITFIFQPLGSFFSGLLFEPLGRKTTMIYVNIPLIIGWLIIYFASEVSYLYAAEILMGLSIGFMDAPHITYLGEITQPKWRGILTSYAEICVSLGFCFVYFLGAITKWRTVIAVCILIPILSVAFISQIPESPIWLISKKRMDAALQSLCWLRGWVDPVTVQKEFSDFNQYFEFKSDEKDVAHKNEGENHNPSKTKNIIIRNADKFFKKSDLLQKSTLQPLFLTVILFGFSHAAGVTSTRPFMVDILKEFGTLVNSLWITAISSVVGIIGFITGMILVSTIGKRLISIISISGCAVMNGLISVYSFDITVINQPWIPVFLIILLNFFWSFGVGQTPWMLISEVFPFRGRGTASGIAAAISYIQAFIFTKTYYSLYNSFSLSGVFAFYGFCNILGGIFIYKYLPETEAKTLAQIELDFEHHFNQCSKKRNNPILI